jgi:hypothetical protein
VHRSKKREPLTKDGIMRIARQMGRFRTTLRWRDSRLDRQCRRLVREGQLQRGPNWHPCNNREYIPVVAENSAPSSCEGKMKFQIPDPALEYKLDQIEWYESRHGWPAVRLQLSQAGTKDIVNVGTMTMSVHDVERIVRARPTVRENYDDFTETVIRAMPANLSHWTAARGAIAECVLRLKASGLSEDTIGSCLMESAEAHNSEPAGEAANVGN